MKQTFLLGLLFLFFTSCSEYYELSEFSETYRVFASDMEVGRTDETGDYLFYEITEPALTRAVFNRGMMTAYLRFRVGNVDTMSPLPFSDFLVDRNGYKREEQLTVEFQPGRIVVILKVDDHKMEAPFYPHYDIVVRW